ncbi:MAG: hypothetical protein ACLSAF_21965 [Intestinimonas sp.]
MTNLEEKKRRLAQLAAACTDPSETESEASEEELDEYSLQTAAGKLLYESFTDEELLNVVRKTAERLGHSPAQREVFLGLPVLFANGGLKSGPMPFKRQV